MKKSSVSLDVVLLGAALLVIMPGCMGVSSPVTAKAVSPRLSQGDQEKIDAELKAKAKEEAAMKASEVVELKQAYEAKEREEMELKLSAEAKATEAAQKMEEARARLSELEKELAEREESKAGAELPRVSKTPEEAEKLPASAAPRHDELRAVASISISDGDSFGVKSRAMPPAAADPRSHAAAPRPVPKMAAPPAPPPPPPMPAAAPPLSPNIIDGTHFKQVRVFYGTDRLATGVGEFGPRRNLTATPISYGSIFVSIPREHKPGMIERPSLWKWELAPNPEDHMVILNRIPKTREEFLDDIRETLARNGSESSFIFVHGFNVSFDDAARRTAQITYDLNYGGAPVFYSWPSEGGVEDYETDYENSDWARANLKQFLFDYVEKSGARDIYLIAHSMGNRALTFALIDLFKDHPEMRNRFKEIILAAPDVDADIFKRDIAPVLTGSGERITLYVSAGDKALLASKKIRSNYVRLGDASSGIAVIPGIETIDATGLDTSFLEHSYFAENSVVREDIRKLVQEHLRAAQRGLKEVLADPGQVYWKFLLPP